MFRNLVKSTSCFLAIAYLTLAMFGHALHDHGLFGDGACDSVACGSVGCDDSACGDRSAGSETTVATCDCGSHRELHRALAKRDAAEADAAAKGEISSQLLAGCPHECLACIALSHLSVGYAELSTLATSLGETERSYLALEAVALSTGPVIYGPRGPPLLGC